MSLILHLKFEQNLNNQIENSIYTVSQILPSENDITYTDGVIDQYSISTNQNTLIQVSGLNGNGFTLTPPCTFAWWSKTSSSNSIMPWVLQTDEFTSGLNLWHNSTGYYYLNTGDSRNNPFQKLNGTNIDRFVDNAWHFFSMVFTSGGNEGVVRLYIDGTYAGKALTYKNPICSESSCRLFIGGGFGYTSSSAYDPTRYDWIGQLDDFRLYDDALQDGQISRLYGTLTTGEYQIDRITEGDKIYRLVDTVSGYLKATDMPQGSVAGNTTTSVNITTNIENPTRYAGNQLTFARSDHVHDIYISDIVSALQDAGYSPSEGGGGGGVSNSFSSISVGQNTLTAEGNDTLTLIAGNNISFSANPTNKSITINATGSSGGGFDWQYDPTSDTSDGAGNVNITGSGGSGGGNGTDQNVNQILTNNTSTYNNNYSLLFENTPQSGTNIDETRKAGSLTYNPYSKILQLETPSTSQGIHLQQNSSSRYAINLGSRYIQFYDAGDGSVPAADGTGSVNTSIIAPNAVYVMANGHTTNEALTQTILTSTALTFRTRTTSGGTATDKTVNGTYIDRWNTAYTNAAKVTNIGTIVEGTYTDNISSSTSSTTIRTFTIGAGTWIISVVAHFASNSGGYRLLSVDGPGTSDGNYHGTAVYPAVSGTTTVIRVTHPVVTTASSNTYNIQVRQNSGSKLSTQVTWRCVRII